MDHRTLRRSVSRNVQDVLVNEMSFTTSCFRTQNTRHRNIIPIWEWHKTEGGGTLRGNLRETEVPIWESNILFQDTEHSTQKHYPHIGMA